MLYEITSNDYSDYYGSYFEDVNKTFDGCIETDRDNMYLLPIELCLNYVDHNFNQRFRFYEINYYFTQN